MNWKCTYCEAVNPAEIVECDACGTKRKQDASWKCQVCETVNSSGFPACEVCGSERNESVELVAGTSALPALRPGWEVPGKLKFTEIVEKKKDHPLRKRSRGEMGLIFFANFSTIALLGLSLALSPVLFLVSIVGLAVGFEVLRRKKMSIFYKEPEPETYSIEEQKEKYESGHREEVLSVVFDNKRELLFSLDKANRVCAWDVETGVRKKYFKMIEDNRLRMFLTKDYVVGHTGQLLRQWNRSGKKIREFTTWGAKEITTYSVTPESNVLAFAFKEGFAGVWNLDKNAFRKIELPDNRVIRQMHIPDENHLLIYDGNVHLLNLKSEGYNMRWKGNAGDVTALNSLKTDSGYLLAIADKSGNIILKKELGETEKEFWLESNTYSDRYATVLRFIPEKQLLVSGDSFGSVVLWDLESGSLLRQFTGRLTFVHALCYDEMSGKIAAAGAPHHVGVWQL